MSCRFICSASPRVGDVNTPRLYSRTCRQEGHKATATPTPIETITSKVTVSPMRKRRID